MDLAKLKLFAVVAKHGSVSRAAIAVGSAASAISRNIALLEQECGGRLFYRTGRGVVLTELGSKLITRIRPPLQEIEQVVDELQASAGDLVGTVRVGILAAVAHPMVGELFRRLSIQHPAIRLHFVQGSSDQLDGWLANGMIDLAILTRNSKAATKNEQLLAILDSYLVGATESPMTRSDTLRFARLNGIPLVLQGPNNGLRVALEAMAKKKGIRLKVIMESDALSILKDVVTEGGCYMISTWQAVEKEVMSGTLRVSRILNPGIQRYVTLTMSTPASQASRAVARMIRAIGIQGRSQAKGRS
jgi:LysR family nitrogen assimilation transcriptional regulator